MPSDVREYLGAVADGYRIFDHSEDNYGRLEAVEEWRQSALTATDLADWCENISPHMMPEDDDRA